MNITSVKNNQFNYYQNKRNNNITFNNGQLVSTVFMEINKHDILGTSIIDLLSMVIPRSIIDFTRNKQAGIETSIRESSSTATHASIGLSGLGAVSLLSMGLKKKNYGVDFKSITANDKTIDALSEVFKDVVKNNPSANKDDLAKQFLGKIFENVEGLGGNVLNGDVNPWQKLKNVPQKIGEETINTTKNIVDILVDQQKRNAGYKLKPDTLNKLMAYMNMDMPSTQNLKVTLGKNVLETSGEHFLADAHSLTKAFTQENVLKTFKESADAASSQFIKDLKHLSLNKTILGLSAICAIALSVQTINRKLTKKRTGSDGFVGDPNYDKNSKANTNKKEKDPLFVPLKAFAMVAMGFCILKTIGFRKLPECSWTEAFSDFISKVQFKGNLPTMNQIKLVYGSTILGRLFAAKDKNELRESSFRDFLGYTNFLVLGAMVTKCFVNWKDKTLINYAENKGKWDWLTKSTIKTHEEVINSSLKNGVFNTAKDKVLSIKELAKAGKIKKTIADKLSVLNKAKLVGMLYSCIALGVFVPLINKYITEKKHKKEELRQQTALTFTSSNTDKTKTQTIIENFLKTQSA